MAERRSDDYYRELEERLRLLTPLVEGPLSPEVVGWYTEYLDAGEYGLAVEVAAEGLPAADAHPQVRELALALLFEADGMRLAGPPVDHLRALARREGDAA